MTTNLWSATTSVAERGLGTRQLYAILMNAQRGGYWNLPKEYILLIILFFIFNCSWSWLGRPLIVVDTFRWKTGEWTDCSKTCNEGHPGERTREVICTDESHGIETEVEELHCVEPKPAGRETCAHHPCPAEWVTVKSSSVSTSQEFSITQPRHWGFSLRK